MSDERCVDCKYFVFVDRWENTIGELDDIGKCRRFPPTIERGKDEDHPGTCTHAWIVGHDWCGEFQRLPIGATPPSLQ